jgi:anti-sigma factor RsiW
MLKQRPNDHLNADQLLQALVDPPDLGTKRQTHLAQCPACQKDLERLKQGFGRLGQTAERMAPAPARPFRLPQKSAQAAWWRFKPMWATVAACALLFAFTVWWPHTLTPPAPVPKVAVRNPDPGLPLFDQADALVDDALPSAINTLAAASDLDDVDEDMDWLIPAADDAQNDDSWI